MKKYLKVLLPLVLVLALAMALSIVAFADDSANEAKIGNTGYATLEEAVAAAQDGDTVVVLKDINRAIAKLNISKDITIDLNGRTVTATAPTDPAEPLVVLNAEDTVVTFTGSGTINVAQRFLQISSGKDGSKFIFNGTGSGIIIKHSAKQAVLMINSGDGAEFTNTHIYASADYGSSPFFPILSGTVSFKDCTVIGSHKNARMFNYKSAGVKFVFDGTYVAAGKTVFNGDAFNATDETKKLDNPADFVMLDARNSTFQTPDVSSTPNIMNFGGAGYIKVSGTMNFDNCEITSYRIFENGANSGVDGVEGGALADGYTLNINCTNSNLNVLSHTNSGQILRGFINYRFEDCNFGILANGGIGGYTKGEYITVINCHFGRDPRKDSNMKNFLLVNSPKDGSGDLAVYYDVTNPEYPFYLCEESKKPVVQPDSILFHNYNLNVKDKALASPLIGTSTTDPSVNDTNLGGNFSVKYGKFEAVSGINGSYLKYTVTDLNGNIPSTPTIVNTAEDPFLVLGDDSKPNLIAYKDNELIVVEFDIKLDNFGVSKFTVAPQSRTEAGAGMNSDSFNLRTNEIDGKRYADSEWHHLQLVIKVAQTANGDYNIYNGSTYQLYVDGTAVGNANRLAVKNDKNADAELYLQGIRINISRNTNQTTGASVSFDNILIHTYKDADSFTPASGKSTNGTLISGGDRYAGIPVEKQNLNLVTDRTVTENDLLVSLKSGIEKDGKIYSDFQGIITDKSQLASGNMIGEEFYVHGYDGSVKSFFATYSNKTASIVVYDKTGDIYMSADNSAEFKTLFESMKDGETAKLIADEFILESHTALLDSAVAKTLNFDLAGNALYKVRKGQIFGNVQNVTLNIYSSLPGGLIDGRGRFDNSVNPSDPYYKFTVNFGAAMIIAKNNSTVNFGAYGSYPGSNLTVTGAYMIEIASNSTNAKLNIDGGTYIRTVRDSVGLIATRSGSKAEVNIKNANLLSGENNPAPLFNIEGTSTLTVKDSTVFMPMPTEAGATAKPLFNALATTATASFTNTSFSNVSFTPANTNASMAGKSVLNAGCTLSATCDITNADLGSCSAATLKDGWKQTFADGSKELTFDAVAATGSATYHFYKESPGNDSNKFAFVWTGDTATDGNGNTVPAGSFTVIYGDIATVCSGDATSGYTLNADQYTYKTLNGNTGEKITLTYIVTAGETVPQGTPYYEMPDQAYIILAEGQRIVTWVLDDSSITEIRDAGDETAPEGFELPSSIEGVYSYTYTLSTETENGVSYDTYTSSFCITLKLLSNISLNDNFKHNVYIPKAFVDAGYIAKDIALNGNTITLNNAVTIDGSGEYYIISVDNIAATNGGDEFTVAVTVNLEDDAIEDSATLNTDYTFSIPAYAQLVLDTPNGTSGVNAECKQMMADVLNYIKLAAIFGGSNYTSKAGYAAVLEVIQAYADADIAPTDTSATDFAAIAKTPSIQGVGDAVSGVTFVIGSSVKVRFYLAEMYDGNLTLTYKDKSGADVSETFAIEDGKYVSNNYVELTLKAYYVAGDITVTFDGQTDATEAVYNLASYIEYYKNDAKVADLAKALYAYANAALAYQNTLN